MTVKERRPVTPAENGLERHAGPADDAPEIGFHDDRQGK
jgi:hypothetical protein